VNLIVSFFEETYIKQTTTDEPGDAIEVSVSERASGELETTHETTEGESRNERTAKP
jgi:hypothetical protein